MHVVKAKKYIEQHDNREFEEKRLKYAEKQRQKQMAKDEEIEISEGNFHPDLLPDGVCINRMSKSVSQDEEDENISTKDAQYIGSFSVVGTDQSARAEFVRSQLERMRTVTKKKPVLLVISLSGVKVCSQESQSIYMAHALKRISYATCDPEYNQFSFLAREPKGVVDSQYCHAFITNTAQEAEQLNTVVGNAFKLAFAETRQSKRLTFNEVIEQQIIEQKQKFSETQQRSSSDLEQRLSAIATATAGNRSQMRKQLREQEVKEKERERVLRKDRPWAKHMVEKAKHSNPITSPKQMSNINSSNSRDFDSPSIIKSTQGVFKSTPDRTRSEHQSERSKKGKLGKKGSPKSSSDSIICEETALEVLANMNSFDMNGDRYHGSPVTALKDTIDRQFTNNNNKMFNGSRYEPENYLYPIAHQLPSRSVVVDVHVQESPKNDILTRPLPAVPNGDTKMCDSSRSRSSWSSEGQRSRESWCSDGQRSRSSWCSEGQRSRESWASTGSLSPPPSIGHGPSSHIQVDAEGSSYMCGGGPSCQIRYDSLRRLELQQATFSRESDTLQVAPWYQSGIPREVALEILQHEDIGSFIVRESSSHLGCFALSVKVPKFDNPAGIAHYLIYRTRSNGVKLRGLDKEWSSLSALVIHHTVMQEMLPCTLRLPKNNKNPAFTEDEKDSKKEDPDYQKLTDCSTLMADLKTRD